MLARRREFTSRNVFLINQRGIKPRLQQTPTRRREFTSRNVF
ncbi:hypothetical protein PNIG_a0483 [Pseudoalteromonas nigrifaciens]|uniref:Uncharacterized protein n=1 Tax=Pseudoalteromonas nigrifaciens TaxID=28109 RepID=A0AAC9UHC1_9GAMM|nr:hypothetical protein PNIG_a0483 [Pseudoalteromonas nigrifaciens]